MIRKTSIEAYNTIKDNGLLSERRWQVYDILFRNGPMTGGEVFQLMKKQYSVMAPTNSNVTTRLGELRNMGAAQELGRRVCTVSGMTVILWDVTDRLPVKLERSTRTKCKSCGGKGYHETTQFKFNIKDLT